MKLIPIDTPKGSFKVWTKRLGNNPHVKILLLHVGPGMTHENWEACDSYFPIDGSRPDRGANACIGAAHDTMDPAHMEWMASQVDEGDICFLYPGDRHLFADSSLPDYDEAAATLLGLRHSVGVRVVLDLSELRDRFRDRGNRDDSLHALRRRSGTVLEFLRRLNPFTDPSG